MSFCSDLTLFKTKFSAFSLMSLIVWNYELTVCADE